MNSPDQDTLLRAIEDARRKSLASTLSPAFVMQRAVERLQAVLDNENVVHPLDRLNGRSAAPRRMNCNWGCFGRRKMDERYLREHAARCRSLAAKADEFTEMRLLALAERYEQMLKDEDEVGPSGDRPSLAPSRSANHKVRRSS